MLSGNDFHTALTLIPPLKTCLFFHVESRGSATHVFIDSPKSHLSPIIDCRVNSSLRVNSTISMIICTRWRMLITKNWDIMIRAIVSPNVHWWANQAATWLLRTLPFRIIWFYQCVANSYPCHYIIHTQHDCPPQMNSNLMIGVTELTRYHSLIAVSILFVHFSWCQWCCGRLVPRLAATPLVKGAHSNLFWKHSSMMALPEIVKILKIFIYIFFDENSIVGI